MNLFLKHLVSTLLCFIAVDAIALYSITKSKQKKLCNLDTNGYDKLRIVEGNKIGVDSYWFMAALVVENSVVGRITLQCGCAIISSTWTLTAAHCIELISQEMVYISAGSSYWSEGHRHGVLDMIRHEDYDRYSMSYDIALIKVKQPFTETNEMPIALASEYYSYTPASELKVLGWGRHNYSLLSPLQMKLEQANVILFNQTHCRDLYQKQGQTVLDSQFCAGTVKAGNYFCTFDSGGPIVDQNVLIGVVSWGVGCRGADSPVVYTRVSTLEKWITKTLLREGDSITSLCLDRRNIYRNSITAWSCCGPVNNLVKLVVYHIFVLVYLK